MHSEKLIADLHQIYRKDPWINKLFKAGGAQLDALYEMLMKSAQNMFFDTAEQQQVEFYEKEAGITPEKTQTLDDRRAAIAAKWASEGKNGIDLLQRIANSWKNGAANVSFTDGKIQLTFNSEYGIPNDLDSLLKAMDEAKPAHLSINYIIKYLLIKEIHSVKTLAEMELFTLDQFAR